MSEKKHFHFSSNDCVRLLSHGVNGSHPAFDKLLHLGAVAHSSNSPSLSSVSNELVGSNDIKRSGKPRPGPGSSQKSDIKRSFGTTVAARTAGRAPTQPGPAETTHVTVVVGGAVTPTRREDAAATTQISIAVWRHPRQLAVINKRYVREKKRKQDTAQSATDGLV